MIDRRSLAAAGAGALLAPRLASAATPATDQVLDELTERTFRYFWETTDANSGLAPDRWPAGPFCSIAAVGFALTAYPLGVERGWVSRPTAGERVLRTLQTFDRLPQGPSASGVAGFRGFFYHFLDMRTGLRFGKVELSSIDTAILHLGMLCAAQAFNAPTAQEAEIRRLAERLVAAADWPWFADPAGLVSMGWTPEQGFLTRRWTGYNEGKMIYVLGLGSAGHPLPEGAWAAWSGSYGPLWRGQGAGRHLAFAPLFGHQYSEMWIDFRGVRDAPMRQAGLDYAENGRRAAYADRAYCIDNPMGWLGYGAQLWGLTACDGPADATLPFRGREASFYGYAARGPLTLPEGRDDGTLAPTAALGSLAAAPEIAIPAALAMRRYAGGALYGRYGFVDAFNPSFRYPGQAVQSGRVDPRFGWIDSDHVGIDQGPILGALCNRRNGSVWRLMRGAPTIRRGLERAGFTGGWLDGASHG